MHFPNIYLEGDDGEIYHYQSEMLPFQRAFHTDSSKFRWLGGGVGGGKSVAALIEVFRQSWQYRDNYGYILRETQPDIKKSAYKDFHAICPRWMVYEENRQENWIDILNHVGADFILNKGGNKLKRREKTDTLRRIKGLSRIEFASFEGTLRGETKFRSANIGWYFIEQAESAYLEVYDILNERLRRKPSGRKAIFVSNPDGHNWLWRIFHPDSPERRKNHAYFPVSTSDNPSLPDDYHETLFTTYDKDKYAKMVLGSHDVATGAVFPEFSRHMHVVDHFDPPEEWIKGIGLDSGLRNPTAAIFLAILPAPFEGVYVFREYLKSETIVSEHAKALKHFITPSFQYFEIDPETRKRNMQTLSTVIGDYNSYGIPFSPAANDVHAGINRIKEYMAFDSLIRHPVTNALGAPRLLVSHRCPQLINQLHECRFAEQKTGRGFTDPPDEIQRRNIDLVDAFRYIVVRVTPPLTSKSQIKREPQRTNRYEDVKVHKHLDENGNYSIGKLIEEAQKLPPLHQDRISNETTWLSY